MRRWIKRIFYAVLAIMVVLFGFYLYVFHLGGLESAINSKIDSLLDPKYNLSVEIGDIKGSYLKGIELNNIDIYYGQDETKYRLLHLPKLATAYSLSNLWKAQYVLDYLILDSAQIEIHRDQDGQWQIPDFSIKDTTSQSASMSFPSISIGSIEIEDMVVKVISAGDTLSLDDILIAMEFKGEEKSFAIDLEHIEYSSDKQIPPLNTAGGKLTIEDNNLLFKDLTFVSGPTRVKFSGSVNLSDTLAGQIDFAADNLNLNELSSYAGPKLKGDIDMNGSLSFVGSSIEGSLDIGGKFMFASLENIYVDFNYNDRLLTLDTVYGTIMGNCSVDGYGLIDFTPPMENYEIIVDVRQFNLANLLTNSFQSDLNGHMVLMGESFRHKTMKLDLDVDLYESHFDQYPIHQADGKMIITTRSITFTDSFNLNYFDNLFLVEGEVIYSDTMALDITAYLNDLERYREKLFIDQPGGRGYAEALLTGKTSDPDIDGFFISDSVWIYGLFSDSLYTDFTIDRFLTGRQGFVSVDFYDGSAWDIPYDTGFGYFRIDSNMVYFDTVNFKNKLTYMNSNGSVDYEIYPNQLFIDTFYINLARQKFYNRGEIAVEIDSLGFDFIKASVGNKDQWLAAHGRVDYDESMDIILSINEIPIAPWKNLYEDSVLIEGMLSCEALLRGTFMNPKFDLKANITQLMYEELTLGNVSIDVDYSDKKLLIDSISIYSLPGIYKANGFMNIDLAFTSDSLDRFPNSPMDIHFSAVDRRFDLVSFLLPSVEIVEGDFFADFSLTGTPQEPHLEGVAYVKGYEESDKNGKMVYQSAFLKYFDLEERIYTDSIGVTMSDNFIHLDSLEVYFLADKYKSICNIDGDITIKSLDNFHYDIDIAIPQPIPFTYELDDIIGKAVGRLHVEGDTPPLVTGEVEIVENRYLVNFSEPHEGSPIMRLLFAENSWDLDINLDIPSNYWIKNEDIDAEFSGEMKIERYQGIYKFSGQLEILRGKGYLFDKTIRLDPGGSVTFQGNDKFNPALDITGYTRITAAPDRTEDNATTEMLTLGLHITGYLEEPQINVTEDSDFESNSDIIPALVANYGGSSEVSSIFEQSLTNLVSAQMSQIGTRQLSSIGVETFEIDPYYQGEFNPLETRVTLGFYTSPNLYVYGRSAISGQTRQEVGFEYRWKKWVLVKGLLDEKELYHLNLRLNWEF